jgi:hypothetical protein
MRAAFLAFQLAPGALKNLPDSQDLSLLINSRPVLPVKRPPVVHIDNFRHGEPPAVIGKCVLSLVDR